MSDDEIIVKAESLGFKFYKHYNCWKWTVTAPDDSCFICEQGDPEGMKWIREKLTYFL
jgi:hypothetical protein